MQNLISNILSNVHYLFYVSLLLITLYVVKELIEAPLRGRFAQARYYSRLRRQRANIVNENWKERSVLFRHIYLLRKSTNDNHGEGSVVSFFIMSSLIFSFSFILMFLRVNDLFMTVFISFLLSFIPYLYLQVKIRNLRHTVGNELTAVVQSLLQNYNALSYDMIEALSKTKDTIEDVTLRQVFVQLINNLQTSKTEDDLRLIIDEFIYTCGNSWAKRLGNVILKSHLYKENVINALMIITKQMEDTEKMLEEEKSESQDTVWNGYLTIILFPASLVMGYYVTGPQDWFQLQFGSPYTLLLFMICSVTTAISLLISLMLRKPRNDL